MIGATVSHYRIVEKIGVGGMGEVYRAHDKRLGRDVAIKVLPGEFAQNAGRLARFEREARAAAKLSHPNIIEIFEFGREGAVTYAVTELLAGETLGERLGGGEINWRKAAEIGAAISDGLAAAHTAGIVHRDLKPSNVFLTSNGRVKILDFGLAATVETAEGNDTRSPTISRYTDPGSVLGTVGYMSPEQVRGEPADHRSDIFSFGCVLYEMLSGRGPFQHDGTAECMAAILRDDPPPIGGRGIPEVLAQVVYRCLEKRPEERFQSAAETAVALRTLAAAAEGPAIARVPEAASIVVLPFEDMSPDRDNEYFSDGLTEEVISDLAKVRALRVISRTSAMRLKGSDKSIETISRELNTRYVLEGSVRKAGTDLRITAQLIDAPNDTHLWSDKYSGNLDDVFDIQEKVSRSIVDALELKLNPDESRRLAERPIDNIQAYECYLRARREMHSFTEQGFRRALRDLQNGLEIVGDNALLYLGLGEVYVQYYEFGIQADEATLKKAEEFADKVLELDPDSPHIPYLLGRIERLRGSTLKAIRHFERALVKDPDSPDTLFWLGLSYALEAGKPSDALQLAKRLVDVDPLTPTTHFALGIAHWMGGRLDQALSCLEKNVLLEPESAIARLEIAYVLMWKNERQRAFELIDQMTRTEPLDAMHRWVSPLLLFFKHAFRKEKREALEAFREDVKSFCWNDPALPWHVAGIYSVMDEKDEAIRWLEHAIDGGWINYPLFAEQDPFLENIRGEERFKKLMERIKPEWEQFEV